MEQNMAYRSLHSGYLPGSPGIFFEKLSLHRKEIIMTTYKLVATAAAGIEALVGKELRTLGYDCQVENGKAILLEMIMILQNEYLFTYCRSY